MNRAASAARFFYALANKLEFIEQLALLTITNYKLQITNGYITEEVFI